MIMKPYSIETSFNPHGLKALLVDHNPTSLFLLSKMLQSCHYQVTTCQRPTEALKLIRNGKNKFDMVITDVHFSSDINGIQYLEIIQHETDLPVVIVSADDRNDTILECVKKGACAYLPKPVRMEVIRLLWQHVARKEILRFRPMKQVGNVENNEPADSSSCGEDNELCGSSDGSEIDHWKTRRQDEHGKGEGKKHRLVWTDALHQQFVDAVKQLGINNAVPKKVLELMNVPGITRENVASHLQKYRLNLRKQTGLMQERVPIGDRNSVMGHSGVFLGTLPVTEIQTLKPLNHHGMDVGSNSSIFPFHEPDYSLQVMGAGLSKMEEMKPAARR